MKLNSEYMQANPEASGSSAPPAPPASDPASSEVIADVDWGSVSTAVPGIDDPYDDANPPDDSASPEPAPTTNEPPPPAQTPSPPASTGTPPTPPAPPAPTPPAPPKVDPAEEAKARAELEKQIIAGLADKYSKGISEDDARELAINPEKVMPRLMAQAVLDAVTSMQGMLQQQLPKVVEDTTRNSAARAAAAKSFFDANPDLAKPEYKSVLDQAAAIYRSTHPNASRDEAVKGVARVARATLGLSEPTSAPPPPSTPAPTRPAAFVPVAPGGSSRPSPSGGRQKTVWDDLID